MLVVDASAVTQRCLNYCARPRESILDRCRIRLTEFSAGLADFETVGFSRSDGLRAGQCVAGRRTEETTGAEIVALITGAQAA